MNHPHFAHSYAALHRRAMRYGKTIGGAIQWLDKTRTGSNKRANVWSAYASPLELTVAIRLRAFYSSIPRD